MRIRPGPLFVRVLFALVLTMFWGWLPASLAAWLTGSDHPLVPTLTLVVVFVGILWVTRERARPGARPVGHGTARRLRRWQGEEVSSSAVDAKVRY